LTFTEKRKTAASGLGESKTSRERTTQILPFTNGVSVIITKSRKKRKQKKTKM
jgi:hypothetical protein